MSSSLSLPGRVTIQEVGPRDGLQNEKQSIPTEVKIRLIDLLSQSGLTKIEGGSFVSSKWVPQMADSEKIFQHLSTAGAKTVSYSALTPNLQGLDAAIHCGVKEVAVFGAASEKFSQKNINCDIDTSLRRFEEVCSKARQQGIKVRGYVSCVLGCPYRRPAAYAHSGVGPLHAHPLHAHPLHAHPPVLIVHAHRRCHQASSGPWSSHAQVRIHRYQ
jgi:hydroxymethylglutaryl-CoA lyase